MLNLELNINEKNERKVLLNLHFVWIQPHLERNKGDENERKARDVANKWGELKNTKIFFWTREEFVREFPELVLTLEKISIAAWISDILRYQVVNRYGGLYLDTDILFLKDPSVVLEQNNGAFTVCQTPWIAPGGTENPECESVINAIIAATPGHPSLTCAIQESLTNTLNALEQNGGKTPPYNSANSGPTMWTQCAKKYNMPILASWTFLPCMCCEGCLSDQYTNLPDVYGMHQWLHSWW
jgi:hypothetical protein